MKRLKLRFPAPPKTALLVVAAGAAITLGAFLTTRHPLSGHTGGMVAAVTAPKAASKLPPATASTATRAQSVAATNCAENGTGKLLLVSISQQHIWACDGTALVSQSAVTTGTTQIVNGVDDATPTGTWRIYGKHTNTVLRGCDANGCWNDQVAYWMPFDGEVGFHDASWQTLPFGGSQYHTDGSHGCVHLPTDFIVWVYAWAPIGTTVTVET